MKFKAFDVAEWFFFLFTAVFVLGVASVLLAGTVQIVRMSDRGARVACRAKCAPKEWEVGTLGIFGKELTCTCNQLKEVHSL